MELSQRQFSSVCRKLVLPPAGRHGCCLRSLPRSTELAMLVYGRLVLSNVTSGLGLRDLGMSLHQGRRSVSSENSNPKETASLTSLICPSLALFLLPGSGSRTICGSAVVWYLQICNAEKGFLFSLFFYRLPSPGCFAHQRSALLQPVLHKQKASPPLSPFCHSKS